MTCLRVLKLCDSGLLEITRGTENLIHLRYLDLSGNKLTAKVLGRICNLYNLQTLNLSHCGLKEVPKVIGNLIHLRHLDLSRNRDIEELPETICNLHDLETLDLSYCGRLVALPEGINRLVNLRHLPNDHAEILYQIPQGFEQLTGLQTLRLFHAGKREDVYETWNAELRNKVHIRSLTIWFVDAIGRAEQDELVRNEALVALQPHPNLRSLTILDYQGTQFPGWISSYLNHLRVLRIEDCNYVSTLPCLGKLPELEELSVGTMRKLTFVGREFLGIAGDIDGSMASSAIVVRFPKLKKLSFWNCPRWKEWEDITAEEEGSATVSIMPCLKELKIDDCWLTKVPHRLLRKVSVEHLTVQGFVPPIQKEGLWPEDRSARFRPLRRSYLQRIASRNPIRLQSQCLMDSFVP
ncbi:putative disease resistance protein RGA1 [Sesamum angolense]|uniref:Disease resistance protein RGA1 n=1 Tax=Sesamum angolense TaxID=2727404 RepID=A0AAE1WKQ5_9LAMI|nr:putative disease resistance protein RGA1 [Sesamum angolense]